MSLHLRFQTMLWEQRFQIWMWRRFYWKIRRIFFFKWLRRNYKIWY